MADMTHQSAISSTATPVAPYSRRPPSPPYIPIPVSRARTGSNTICLMPSYENVDSSRLSSHDVGVITQNRRHIANDQTADWTYEMRRQAQPIVDFLSLGPSNVVRDHDYLKREGITMILATRDSRMATRPILSVERAAQTCNIPSHYVDVDGPDQLIKAFPGIIGLINDHLLAIYHSQAQGKNQQGQLLVESANFRRGKVLVTCETGNDRSAAIVAAYIMAVFGTDMITTILFICAQRFCCCFDEDIKRKLQTWEDIIRARSQVAAEARTATGGATMAKRCIEDAMVDDFSAENSSQMDRDRFVDREAFVPFLDTSN